jgi:hypothetical protein
VNHLLSEGDYHLGLAFAYLDQAVTSKDQDDIRKNNRLHLHVWHGDTPFSKFDCKDGKYKEIDPARFQNDTSASGYVSESVETMFNMCSLPSQRFQAMRLALESARMSASDLKNLLIHAKANI